MADRRTRWRERHPEKYAAQQAVKRALATGALEREGCLFCGHVAQAHHHDYTKPLEVTWLCCVHHHMAHGRMNAAQVKAALNKRALRELRSQLADLRWRDERGRFLPEPQYG